MSNHVFHFFSSYEGTAVNQETLPFARFSSELTITNDSAADPLCFKFDMAEQYATVYANESVTIRIQANNIIIDAMGQSVPYRIWEFT